MTAKEFIKGPNLAPLMGILLAAIVAMIAGVWVDRHRGPGGFEVKWITPIPGVPATLPPYGTAVLAAYPADGAAIYVSVKRIASTDNEDRPMDIWLLSSAEWGAASPDLMLPIAYTAEPQFPSGSLFAREAAIGKGPVKP